MATELRRTVLIPLFRGDGFRDGAAFVTGAEDWTFCHITEHERARFKVAFYACLRVHLNQLKESDWQKFVQWFEEAKMVGGVNAEVVMAAEDLKAKLENAEATISTLREENERMRRRLEFADLAQ